MKSISKNKKDEENKSYRTIQFVVKNGHPLNKYFMDMMYKSNNLYNATNFHLRQLWTALKVDLIETVCKEGGVDIEIIDSSQKADEQELVEDMIQIITVFSCRLEGKIANKAKKILKEMESIESFA